MKIFELEFGKRKLFIDEKEKCADQCQRLLSLIEDRFNVFTEMSREAPYEYFDFLDGEEKSIWFHTFALEHSGDKTTDIETKLVDEMYKKIKESFPIHGTFLMFRSLPRFEVYVNGDNVRTKLVMRVGGFPDPEFCDCDAVRTSFCKLHKILCDKNE